MDYIYDKETLWTFKKNELKSIIIANNIQIHSNADKRHYIDAILKYQGNFDEEYHKIDKQKIIKQNNLLKILENRDIKSLKKLKISELIDINNYFKINPQIEGLKGEAKREVLISSIIRYDLLEKTKYERYYVYPGHWFRDDYEKISSSFHNVQCSLCYKQTGIFKKQFNTCKDCHLILQKEFCRRYLIQYQLSCLIIEHIDIRSYLWGILKHIL